MANWKKVVVSGSDAALNKLTVSSIEEASGLASPYAVVITGSGGELFFTSSDAIGGGGTTTEALTQGNGIVDFSFNGSSPKTVAVSSSDNQATITINSNGIKVADAGIGTTQIATTLGTLGVNQFTGSFTGSFSGDGTNLTGVTGATTDEALSFGGGLSGSAFASFDGENAVTAQLKGHESLLNNKIVKWDSANSKFVNSTITDDANDVTISTNLIVNGNATFGDSDTDKVTIKGDLIVNGTASFVNQTSLQIADKFIALNSGSTGVTAGGGIVIGNKQTQNSLGSLFGVSSDVGSSTGDRFGIKANFNYENTSFPSLDAFMGLTSASTSTTSPNVGGQTSTIMKEQGNIYISDSEGSNTEIWIYA